MYQQKYATATVAVAHEKPAPAKNATGDLLSDPVKVYCSDGFCGLAVYATRTRTWLLPDGTALEHGVVDRYEAV